MLGWVRKGYQRFRGLVISVLDWKRGRQQLNRVMQVLGWVTEHGREMLCGQARRFTLPAMRLVRARPR